ncbi:hypothetical protein PIIN_10133 [Serendipita indica DSM 11827]|uniref:Uncharacterized protein n=1 Tax=Serendipita indica (strain DSM 11827) TaxID=1109443 RepID=G4TXU0_SERID|nr:hypothetical protein PIIN_10133 [Serendipita indica DSM 11827]
MDSGTGFDEMEYMKKEDTGEHLQLQGSLLGRHSIPEISRRGDVHADIEARDEATGYPEGPPLRTASAKTVSLFPFEEIISRWGATEEIVTMLQSSELHSKT